jgi:hypothetical protein
MDPDLQPKISVVNPDSLNPESDPAFHVNPDPDSHKNCFGFLFVGPFVRFDRDSENGSESTDPLKIRIQSVQSQRHTQNALKGKNEFTGFLK